MKSINLVSSLIQKADFLENIGIENKEKKIIVLIERLFIKGNVSVSIRKNGG